MHFLDALEKSKTGIHGFCLIRDGHIFAEGYWKPFHRHFQHRMYSVGKSFASLAIGLLMEEGRLSIHDPIISYFPEKLGEDGAHPFLTKTTIRDMLMMASPHLTTTYKRYSGDWVESFFRVEPNHRPGTVFSYDTSSSHVLTALVEKLSGKPLLAYLKEKVLNRLAFSKEARFIPDPAGVSQGGSGLLCTLEDLYSLAYVCLNKGRFNELQLLPEDYLREATAKQIDTSAQPVIDEQQGYGYQFWRTRNNGFAMYGMGGQLAVCLPEYKLLYATIGDTTGDPTGVQNLYEAFWENIYPSVVKNTVPLKSNAEEQKLLEERLEKLAFKTTVEGEAFLPWNTQIDGKKYSFAPNEANLVWMRLKWNNEAQITLDYENHKGVHSLLFQPGEVLSYPFSGEGPELMACGGWVCENNLTLQVNVIGEVFGNVRAQLVFRENTVTVYLKRTAEDLLKDYSGIATGILE